MYKKTAPLQVQKKLPPASAQKDWPVDRNHLSRHFLWKLFFTFYKYFFLLKHKNVNYKITCLAIAVTASETAAGKNVYLGQW